MKKLIASAFIAAMLTSAVFAQNLSLGGYFNTGLGVISTEDSNQLKAYGADADKNAFRFRLNGSYQNEAKDAGFRFRIQAQSSLTAVTTSVSTDGTTATASNRTTTEFLSLPYAFGWVSFFDNKLNLSGGIIEDSAWSTGDWWLASDSVAEYAGLGALLKITPADGLIFGLGAQTIGRQGGSQNNTLFVSGNNLNNTIDLEKARYNLHAGYTMKDTFRFDFSYRNDSEVGGGNTSRLFADLRLLSINNLTAVVAVSIDKLEDFSDNAEIIVSETFAYKIDSSLSLGLNAAQYLFNNDTKETSMVFNFWGSYAIDSIVPRLDVLYLMGGSSASGTPWFYGRSSFSGYGGSTDNSVLSIKPSVKINLDSRTFLEIGDMINIDMDKDDSNFTNVFYIDLKWQF